MDLTHIYERRVDPTGQDSLARIARLVRPGSTVLELGPATGYFTRHLAEALNCTVDCIEFSPEMADMARPFAREMLVGDLDYIELSEHFAPASYDHVIAADVLEHLKNPWRVLSGCRSLLAADGSALLSIPNIGHAALIAELIAGRFEYRDEGLLDRTHLRFFTRASIVDMLRRTGFRPRMISRIEWRPEMTEFERNLDALSPRLRDCLLAHGDALTYQFIVEAAPGEMSTTEAEAAVAEGSGPAEPFFLAKVYWATEGRHLTEARCIVRAVSMQQEVAQVQFDLPVGEPVTHLRFDPADRAGFFRIQRIRITEHDSQGREIRTHLDCVDHPAVMQRFDMKDTALGTTTFGSTFISLSDDPKLFHLPAEPYQPGPDHHLRFDVEMTWPVSADYMIAEAIYRDKLTELRATLSLTEARLKDYADRLEPMHRLNATLARERDEAFIFEPILRQHEVRVRELEARLAEIYGSRSWKLLSRWRRFKARFQKKRQAAVS